MMELFFKSPEQGYMSPDFALINYPEAASNALLLGIRTAGSTPSQRQQLLITLQSLILELRIPAIEEENFTIPIKEFHPCKLPEASQKRLALYIHQSPIPTSLEEWTTKFSPNLTNPPNLPSSLSRLPPQEPSTLDIQQEELQHQSPTLPGPCNSTLPKTSLVWDHRHPTFKRKGFRKPPQKMSHNLEQHYVGDGVVFESPVPMQLAPIQWDMTLPVPAHGTSYTSGHITSVEAESGITGPNSTSIRALLNPAEHIATTTQGQQYPSAREPSVADRIDLTPRVSPTSFASEGPLLVSGWDVTASGEPGFQESDGGRPTCLEPQGMALYPPRKRKRADSFSLPYENSGCVVTPKVPAGVNPHAENVSSVDLSSFPSLSGPKSNQEGTIKETSPKHVDFSVPRAPDNHQVEESRRLIAKVAEAYKLAGFIGDYLLKGMDKCQVRLQEKETGMLSFTEAMRLHFGDGADTDFQLEVLLCSSAGRAISQAKMRPFEDLKSSLGNYLFDAMKTSIWRKGEGKSDYTGAVDVVFPHGDDGISDCILRVMLNFAIGVSVYRDIFS